METLLSINLPFMVSFYLFLYLFFIEKKDGVLGQLKNCSSDCKKVSK